MKRSLFLFAVLSVLCIQFAWAQQKITITGVVKDSKGSALPGVSVSEKGTTNGTMTDGAGSFKLSASSTGTLVFSYIGYLKQEVAVGGNTSLNVSLADDPKGLQEVVVTAMGIKRETRALGYAVSTVTSKELTQTGSTNFASALYGKAAGVKIVAAPGGASSAVTVQIRGVNSYNGSTQPLYVVDGVPIRNFNSLTQSSWNTTNNRIDGNGALDINPEDIESLSVLKGASATALYGSEAGNGVVIITTKKGTKGAHGIGVDVNYIYNTERVASTPDYQETYGPGYDAQTNLSIPASYDGWVTDADGSKHPFYRAYAQFGPKFNGQDVKYWDGTTKKYSAVKNNYKDFYEKGYNSTLNVAMSNASDAGNYRFSYSRIDYKSIMPGSNLYKNNFNFNGTLNLSKKISLDVVSTYNNNFTHNRPEAMGNLFGSYNGFASRMDDMETYKTRYQTSNGYKYVTYNNTNYDQDQKFLYNMRATNLLDYMWNNMRNSYDETQNRFINSVTLNVSILDNLRFRARAGGDFTTLGTEDKEHNEKPSSLGYTGRYWLQTRVNNVIYGDAMVVYSPKITNDLGMSLTGGLTGRKQNYSYQSTSTNGGLVNENWFSVSNSANTVSAQAVRAEQIDVATFGILNLNYKSFLYVEGTARYEATSTLAKGNNTYFYPSFNAGFVFSDVVKLPSFISYGKLRASYGLVGNHPSIYQANVAYNQFGVAYNSTNILYQQPNNNQFGNNGLKSEQKRESEFGLETKFLDGKIGLDFSYYNNKIKRQILFATTASSTGATSAIMNAGTLSNYGYEAAINATPISGKDFRWSTRFNFALNRNKLLELSDGLTSLTENFEGGGYAIARSEIGDPLGNIYVHPMTTDTKGNRVVGSNGLYTVNTADYKLVGNIMPKFVGGFSNTFTYKQFALDVTLDYRYGGVLTSIPTYYQLGGGMFKSTLQYRDAAHGGIAYNVTDEANAVYVAAAGGSRNDGLILPGVKADGTTNDKVVSAANYYLSNYNWRDGDYSAAVMKNSYIKVREVALTYNMPKSIVEKLHFQGLQLSVIGRNLFYIYKSLPYGLDPEVATGSRWLDQGIDNGTAGPTRSLGASLRARF
ncbi:iron complex outermembrane recepter protein [Chitinophaga sp. YR573]|uniref:SusC/RagA family TonB-linked outer membrane protein n=1 Tax=Chitinophaga sp. YR573 TaxID=1881040 RepID=UPI0008AD5E79|nr:SusC/RagA family TonB-linked outer membrane protein [Chitinophaga sp. YR573]SEW23194.1 iron complex outermembrane recepter protein [Chitinophaga sp. YR573]